VDELGPFAVPQLEAVEQRELLQEDRPLAPRSRLGALPAAIAARDGLLERGLPRGEVVALEQRARREDRVGDETAVEDIARRL
jgi:hypothetical protein